MTTSQEALQCLLCIQYTVQFSRNKIEALVNSRSEINVRNIAFAQAFDITPGTTNIGAQKIDGSSLKIYKMVFATFFL